MGGERRRRLKEETGEGLSELAGRAVGSEVEGMEAVLENLLGRGPMQNLPGEEQTSRSSWATLWGALMGA